MELDLLQISVSALIGLVVGVVLMLIFNKVKSGSASPAGVKKEYEDYKNEVEAHFEATSKKFETMTEQYQDLYKHLAVGATTLCRPDSVAASLVDNSSLDSQPARLEKTVEAESSESANSDSDTSVDADAQAGAESGAKADAKANNEVPVAENAVNESAQAEDTVQAKDTDLESDLATRDEASQAEQEASKADEKAKA